MREVAAEFERPVLLFSGGKDSIVLLRLAEKAFRPAKFPFPLIQVDDGPRVPRGHRLHRAPRRRAGRAAHRRLRAGVDRQGPRRRGDGQGRLAQPPADDDAARRDRRAPLRRRVRRRAPRRGARAGEGADLLLPRRHGPVGPEDPAARAVEPLQRAHPPGEHVRVFPISNWTELDVWEYIAAREPRAARRSTSPTSARSSAATGCSTPPPTTWSATRRASRRGCATGPSATWS